MHIEEFTERLAMLTGLPPDRVERAQRIGQTISDDDRVELFTGLEKLDRDLKLLLKKEEESAEEMEKLNAELEKMLMKMARENEEATEQVSSEEEAARKLEDV